MNLRKEKRKTEAIVMGEWRGDLEMMGRIWMRKERVGGNNCKKSWKRRINKGWREGVEE